MTGIRKVALTAFGAVLITVALLVAAVVPAAAAPPADRAEAVAALQQMKAAIDVPAGWTGSVKDCRVGTESAASLTATLQAVNLVRSFAGVESVVFNPEKNRLALAAALMMRAKGDLSHTPGPDWPCYSEDGADGAGHSNLSLGRSGASAILDGYIRDYGVESLGHRRWVLDPTAMEFGSGSTGSSNALYVLYSEGDGSRVDTLPVDNKVAWPPAGWIPWDWVFADWSIAVGRPIYDSAAPEYVAISPVPTVSVSLNGKSLPVRDVRQLGRGYGTGPLLTWRVSVPEEAERADAVIDVNITGFTLGGSPLPVTYQVKPFATVTKPRDTGTPKGSDRACPVLYRKLKRAQAKFRNAKRRFARLKNRSRKAAAKARFSRRLKRARRSVMADKRSLQKSRARYRQGCRGFGLSLHSSPFDTPAVLNREE